MSYIGPKNIVLIIAAAGIVAFAFWFTEYRNQNTEKTLYVAPEIATSTSSDSSVTSSVDTDGDGLKDWEEVLWGTDPKNPDTDGDAVSDGTEVTQGRNPLVKRTKTVDDSFKALSKTATTTEENLTLTDTFGRDIFSKYIALRQSGQSQDKQSQQELINQLLISSGSYIVNPTVYIETDLIIKDDSSAASLHKYGNDVATILNANRIKSRNEGVIVRDSLDKKDPTILKELDPIIASYRNMLRGLLKVETPRDAVTVEKDLVNSINRILFVAESLRKTDSDPIVALQGVARYIESAQGLFDSLQGIRDYLTSAGVSYTSAEAGVIFKI